MMVRRPPGPLLRFFGFRRLPTGTACLAAFTACGLLQGDTPVWSTVLLVRLSGCVWSVQYLALNMISDTDIPAASLSKGPGVAGVAEHVGRGFGVAVREALLSPNRQGSRSRTFGSGFALSG